jgi:hypothetical protein
VNLEYSWKDEFKPVASESYMNNYYESFLESSKRRSLDA